MSCDQGFRNRSVFENINVEVHPGGFFDQLVEGRHGILWFVFGPIEFLDIGLEGDPVRRDISGEKLDSFLDFGDAIVRKASTALSFGKSKVLAFDIPFFKELCNIVADKLHSAGLSRARHGRSLHTHQRRCSVSRIAGGIHSCSGRRHC